MPPVCFHAGTGLRELPSPGECGRARPGARAPASTAPSRGVCAGRTGTPRGASAPSFLLRESTVPARLLSAEGGQSRGKPRSASGWREPGLGQGRAGAGRDGQGARAEDGRTDGWMSWRNNRGAVPSPAAIPISERFQTPGKADPSHEPPPPCPPASEPARGWSGRRMRVLEGSWDSSCPPTTRDSRGGGPARRGKASCWRPPEVSRSPTASLATAQTFGGKKGIFRLRPAEVPGCLPTSSRAAPSTPGRCRCLHPPAPPGSAPCPTPGASVQPPALSITARRPQALWDPGRLVRDPRGWCRLPGGFFSSTGFSGRAAGLPGRRGNSRHGREPQRREHPSSRHTSLLVQRCVTTGAHSTGLTLHRSLGHYLAEAGSKIPSRDLETHPPGRAGGVKARQGKTRLPQHHDCLPDRGLWRKAELKPATSELTLRKSH